MLIRDCALNRANTVLMLTHPRLWFTEPLPTLSHMPTFKLILVLGRVLKSAYINLPDSLCCGVLLVKIILVMIVIAIGSKNSGIHTHTKVQKILAFL